ncbi:hypothetical protein NDU88_008329 [Pleurodeles waltl]|uniref:Uncharacterized protein n=1 Tax=Pleurodeles waltl TaxID=8319 RepID=A0AAV7RXD5_PLEWA|nr:hypothetical protein NDU88_008329 [Pleurodeles waltl]
MLIWLRRGQPENSGLARQSGPPAHRTILLRGRKDKLCGGTPASGPGNAAARAGPPGVCGGLRPHLPFTAAALLWKQAAAGAGSAASGTQGSRPTPEFGRRDPAILWGRQWIH